MFLIEEKHGKMDCAKVLRYQWGSKNEASLIPLPELPCMEFVCLSNAKQSSLLFWNSYSCLARTWGVYLLFVSRCVDSDELATQGEQAGSSRALPSYLNL